MVLPLLLSMRWAAGPSDGKLVVLLLAFLVGAPAVAGRVGAVVSSGLKIAVGGGISEESDDVVGVWPERSTWGGISGAAHRATGTPAGTARSVVDWTGYVCKPFASEGNNDAHSTRNQLPDSRVMYCCCHVIFIQSQSLGSRRCLEGKQMPGTAVKLPGAAVYHVVYCCMYTTWYTAVLRRCICNFVYCWLLLL